MRAPDNIAGRDSRPNIPEVFSQGDFPAGPTFSVSLFIFFTALVFQLIEPGANFKSGCLRHDVYNALNVPNVC